MAKRKSTTERNSKVIKAYREGQTLQAIGNEIGLTRQRVQQILIKHGEQRRNHERMKELNKPRNKKVIEAYSAGERVVSISKRFNLTTYNVYRITLEAGIGRGGHLPVYEQLEHQGILQRARKLYESGLTLAEVGDRVGFSFETVRRWFAKKGIPRRPPETRNTKKAQKTRKK